MAAALERRDVSPGINHIIEAPGVIAWDYMEDDRTVTLPRGDISQAREMLCVPEYPDDLKWYPSYECSFSIHLAKGLALASSPTLVITDDDIYTDNLSPADATLYSTFMERNSDGSTSAGIDFDAKALFAGLAAEDIPIHTSVAGYPLLLVTYDIRNDGIHSGVSSPAKVTSTFSCPSSPRALDSRDEAVTEASYVSISLRLAAPSDTDLSLYGMQFVLQDLRQHSPTYGYFRSEEGEWSPEVANAAMFSRSPDTNTVEIDGMGSGVYAIRRAIAQGDGSVDLTKETLLDIDAEPQGDWSHRWGKVGDVDVMDAYDIDTGVIEVPLAMSTIDKIDDRWYDSLHNAETVSEDTDVAEETAPTEQNKSVLPLPTLVSAIAEQVIAVIVFIVVTVLICTFVPTARKNKKL